MVTCRKCKYLLHFAHEHLDFRLAVSKYSFLHRLLHSLPWDLYDLKYVRYPSNATLFTVHHQLSPVGVALRLTYHADDLELFFQVTYVPKLVDDTSQKKTISNV